MSALFFLLTVVISTFVEAQDIEKWQSEIDDQVWRPFHRAYESFDAAALNDIYAQEVIRVTPAGIDTEEKFKSVNFKRFAQQKSTDAEVQLDFWFDSRQTNQSTSYEVGMFRIRSIVEGKETTLYGQFHIVVEKQSGVWKITQDWDTDTVNGKKLTAEDFARNSPMDW